MRTQSTLGILFWLWFSDAHAGNSGVTAPTSACDQIEDEAPAFLAHLHASGDHQGLRTRALQLGFEYESIDAQAVANYWLGLSAAHRGDWATAEDYAARMSQLGGDWRPWSSLLKAEIWSIREPHVGLNLLTQQEALRLDPGIAAYADRRELELRITLGDFDGGFEKIERTYTGQAGQLLTHFEGARKRRPVLGALLSAIMPGAGQAYSGRWGEGASALAVNGVFGWGLYSTIRNEQYPAAAIIGLFAVGFYGGNIYGGADAAVRFNRAQRDHLRSVVATTIPRASTPGPCVDPPPSGG